MGDVPLCLSDSASPPSRKREVTVVEAVSGSNIQDLKQEVAGGIEPAVQGAAKQTINPQSRRSAAPIHMAHPNLDFTEFVDVKGRVLCLKFAGFYSDTLLRCQEKGKCRFESPPSDDEEEGEATKTGTETLCCHRSHSRPSPESFERLEELANEALRLTKEVEGKAVDEFDEYMSTRLLPEWFNRSKAYLKFDSKLSNRRPSAGRESPYETMLSCLATLLTGDGSGSVLLEGKDSSTYLSLLHLQNTKITTETPIPILPTLIHALIHRGTKIPKLWKKVYAGRTTKMIEKLERNEAYVKYIKAYEVFIREVVAPLCGDESGVVFQCPPTLRVHMPGRVGTIKLHCDADFDRHESGEINFWVPFTAVSGNNSLFVESSPGAGDYSSFNLAPGEGVRFDGNRCRHFTNANDTEQTRVSIDFRVIPKSLYVGPKHYRGQIGDYAASESGLVEVSALPSSPYNYKMVLPKRPSL